MFFFSQFLVLIVFTAMSLLPEIVYAQESAAKSFQERIRKGSVGVFLPEERRVKEGYEFGVSTVELDGCQLTSRYYFVHRNIPSYTQFHQSKIDLRTADNEKITLKKQLDSSGWFYSVDIEIHQVHMLRYENSLKKLRQAQEEKLEAIVKGLTEGNIIQKRRQARKLVDQFPSERIISGGVGDYIRQNFALDVSSSGVMIRPIRRISFIVKPEASADVLKALRGIVSSDCRLQ